MSHTGCGGDRGMGVGQGVLPSPRNTHIGEDWTEKRPSCITHVNGNWEVFSRNGHGDKTNGGSWIAYPPRTVRLNPEATEREKPEPGCQAHELQDPSRNPGDFHHVLGLTYIWQS